MSCGRLRGTVVPLLLALLTTAGCGAADRAPAAAPTPASAEQLGRLVVTSVPSGLPRMPDGRLRPPAGAKSAADVAAYAGDPARERRVLTAYGYRFGWERFWGRGDGVETSVFVDQFRHAAGARRYADDLARNDAAHYRARWGPRGVLPRGCRLLTAERPVPSAGLPGPAAFGWCARGVFAVAVTVVSRSADRAVDEVRVVVHAQLARLPAG